MLFIYVIFCTGYKKERAAAGKPSRKGSIKPIAEEKAKTLHNVLLHSFRGYRHSFGEKREAMDTLLRLHTEVCRVRPEEHILKRRHNVLVYKYVVDTIASSKVIAKKLGESKESLYQDLDIVIEEMTLLCVGMPYLLSKRKGVYGLWD